MIFENNAVKGGYLEIGGNIMLYGKKTDDSDYRIAVQNPRRTLLSSGPLGVVSLNSKTVSVSGDYQRYYYY